MSATIIARRYAQALLNLATAEDGVEAVSQGLDDLAEVLAQSPRMGNVLISPQVSQADKNRVLAELLQRTQVPELVDQFVRFLAHKHRTAILGDVRTVFHELADQRLGRAQAQLTVAAPISKAEEKQLRETYEKLSGKQITLNVRIDPDILGGAVTRIGSTVWDGSLRNTLNAVRTAITQG